MRSDIMVMRYQVCLKTWSCVLASWCKNWKQQLSWSQKNTFGLLLLFLFSLNLLLWKDYFHFAVWICHVASVLSCHVSTFVIISHRNQVNPGEAFHGSNTARTCYTQLLSGFKPALLHPSTFCHSCYQDNRGDPSESLCLCEIPSAELFVVYTMAW